MALELYIVRHGKAEPHYAGVKDFDRRLVQRGMKEASAVGQAMAERNVMPLCIYTSSAPRALETAELLAEQCGFPSSDLDQREDLYEASVRTAVQILTETPAGQSPVVIVGHNPTLEFLAEYLLDEAVGHLSTSGVIRLELQTENWEALAKGIATQLEFPSR